jgi:hypothetical protein
MMAEERNALEHNPIYASIKVHKHQVAAVVCDKEQLYADSVLIYYFTASVLQFTGNAWTYNFKAKVIECWVES